MPQQNKDLSTMNVRQYLDCTVVPTILQALTQLAKTRPAKPLEFVAEYLKKQSEAKQAGKQAK